MNLYELSWQNLKPELVGDAGSMSVRAGSRLSIELSLDRRCVGYKEWPLLPLVPCPENARLLEGTNPQCDSCSLRDISHIAKTGYGVTKQANTLLGSDHVVYIAYFSNDIIKVGVDIWDRKEVRVREQGAIACLFIAKANGTMARNLERRIRIEVGLTEWVRIDTKLKTLTDEPRRENARIALLAAFEKIQQLAPSKILVQDPQFLFLYQDYGIDDEVYRLPIEHIRGLVGGAVVRGMCVGVLGKVILLRIKGVVYALNSQYMCGYGVDLRQELDVETISGVESRRVAVNRQQSLLDFL